MRKKCTYSPRCVFWWRCSNQLPAHIFPHVSHWSRIFRLAGRRFNFLLLFSCTSCSDSSEMSSSWEPRKSSIKSSSYSSGSSSIFMSSSLTSCNGWLLKIKRSNVSAYLMHFFPFLVLLFNFKVRHLKSLEVQTGKKCENLPPPPWAAPSLEVFGLH